MFTLTDAQQRALSGELEQVAEMSRAFIPTENVERTNGVDGRLPLGVAPYMTEPDEVNDFLRVYRTGDEAARRPYVERYFDAIDSLEMPLAEEGAALSAESFVRDYQKNLKALALCTVIQNFAEDNPQAFAARYDTPEKRQRLTEMGALYAEYSGYMASVMPALGFAPDTQYNFTPDPEAVHHADEEHIQTMTGRLQAQMMANRASSPRADAPEPFRFDIPASRKLPGICGLGERLAQGRAAPRALTDTAMEIYMNSLETIMGRSSSQAAFAKNNGMPYDEFEMIFIDGVSVREKYPQLHAEGRTRELRTLVGAAMVSGQNRVEAATMRYDEEGKPCVDMHTVSADITAIQPTKAEEHGWLRRAFDWGPFKIKTRQEMVDEMAEDTPEREANKRAAEARLKESFVANERAVIHQKALEEQRKTKRSIDDQPYFRPQLDALGGAQIEFRELGERAGLKTLGRLPTNNSLGDLYLLSQGYTLDQLLQDTPEMAEAKRKAGEALCAMMESNDREGLADVYFKGCEAFGREEFPVVDMNNPHSIVASHQRVSMISRIAIDAGQIFEGDIKNDLRRIDPERAARCTATVFNLSSAMNPMIPQMKLFTHESFAAGGVTPDDDAEAFYRGAMAGTMMTERHLSRFMGGKIADMPELSAEILADEIATMGQLGADEGRALEAYQKNGGRMPRTEPLPLPRAEPAREAVRMGDLQREEAPRNAPQRMTQAAQRDEPAVSASRGKK